MASGLQIFLIHSTRIICFLKASIISKVKVVPNGIFKFDDGRVNETENNVIKEHAFEHVSLYSSFLESF